MSSVVGAASPARPFTLVLLPGLDGTGVLFDPLVEALPANITPRVVRYPVDRPLDYQELYPQVAASLPQGEPFVILGESFSGPLALMAAERRPPGLLGVILCATFVTTPAPFLPAAAHRLAGPPLFELFPAFARAKARLTGFSTTRLQHLLAKAHGQVKPAVYAHRLRAVLKVDVTDALLACPVPILYIRGSYDMVVPPRCLAAIRRARPSVQAVMLRAPHLVLQTRPHEASHSIADFAADLTPI